MATMAAVAMTMTVAVSMGGRMASCGTAAFSGWIFSHSSLQKAIASDDLQFWYELSKELTGGSTVRVKQERGACCDDQASTGQLG